MVLTGTDLYRGIKHSALANRAMEAADALVTLQPAGINQLPRGLRGKAYAIIQSAHPIKRNRASTNHIFTVCVLGHLRHEKDPMRAAYALREIDPRLNVQVVQAGEALSPRYEVLADAEMLRNPRYRYLGGLGRTQALKLLANSDLLVQSSRMEGGANALCEAIACGIPVIASRISGNTGILGTSYPGLYRLADSQALAKLLRRAIRSPEFYAKLQSAIRKLALLVSPDRERRLWCSLLDSAVR